MAGAPELLANGLVLMVEGLLSHRAIPTLYFEHVTTRVYLPLLIVFPALQAGLVIFKKE
jgi:hypothetical protein